MVVINSPSNPTGAVYSRQELAALGEVLRAHPQVLIATDDMYEHISLDDAPFSNILNACPDLYPRTMVLNGVSKAYSMTGWRIGYAAGPEPIIQAMTNVQSQSTSNPTSISQVAAEAALNGDQACMAPMLAAFKQRHQLLVDGLNALPGVKCLEGRRRLLRLPRHARRHRTPARRWQAQRAHRSGVLRISAGRRPAWPWCPAPPSAPKAMCGCRSRRRAKIWRRRWRGWRGCWPELNQEPPPWHR